ncbi:MAG: extracellular solute-binding protein [Candidatus Brocadiia bacterium]
MSLARPAVLALAVCATAALVGGCGGAAHEINVVCADALHHSFATMEHEYERLHPDVDVIVNAQGSVQATRLVAFRRSDVLAVADHRLVAKMLRGKQAQWVAKFATVDIGLGYNTASRRRDQITVDNWYRILIDDPEVTYGYADPEQDPCGYYARFAWKLAEDYYAQRGESRPIAQELAANCPPKYIGRDALSLINEKLATNNIDYAFVYRCHAVDLKLSFLPFPKEFSLGDRAMADHYASREMNLPDYKGGKELAPGTYIAFGITVLDDAPNPQGARDFVRFVLSQQGRDILRRSEFQPIHPAQVPPWGSVPDFLSDLAEPQTPAEP